MNNKYATFSGWKPVSKNSLAAHFKLVCGNNFELSINVINNILKTESFWSNHDRALFQEAIDSFPTPSPNILKAIDTQPPVAPNL